MSDFQVPKLGEASPAPAAPSGDFFPADTTVPAGGMYWTPGENDGLLHIFLGNEGPVSVDTEWGTKEAAKCRAIVVFDNGEPYVYTNQQVIQSVLSKQLMTRRYFPARLGQGQSSRGRQAPWVLKDASPEDLEFVNSWLAQNAVRQGEDILLKSELLG